MVCGKSIDFGVKQTTLSLNPRATKSDQCVLTLVSSFIKRGPGGMWDLYSFPISCCSNKWGSNIVGAWFRKGCYKSVVSSPNSYDKFKNCEVLILFVLYSFVKFFLSYCVPDRELDKMDVVVSSPHGTSGDTGQGRRAEMKQLTVK